jgi:Ca2+-binding EF-hand superfamily protein
MVSSVSGSVQHQDYAGSSAAEGSTRSASASKSSRYSEDGSITLLPGVQIIGTVDLKRDGDYGGNVDDTIDVGDANYVFIDESHGTSHRQLNAEEAPEIPGFSLVEADSYGAGDKSGFLYVRDEGNTSDTATIKSNFGDAHATLIKSEHQLGYVFETRDHSYNDSQTITRPQERQSVIYFEDQGGLPWRDGKIRDDGFRDAGFIRINGREGNDNQTYLAPPDWGDGEIPNGNGGQLTLWVVGEGNVDSDLLSDLESNNLESYGQQSDIYSDSINYSDAASFIETENGVTKEVFLRYVGHVFPEMTEQEAETIFNEIDANNSGGLREREFESWSGVKSDIIETDKKSINYSDAENYVGNNSGVTKEVFLKYIAENFPEMTGREAEAIFNEIDANNSGGLRESEFDRWSMASSNTPETADNEVNEQDDVDNDDNNEVDEQDDIDNDQELGVGGPVNAQARIVNGEEYYEIPGGQGAEMNYVDFPANGTKAEIDLKGADYLVIYSSGRGHGDAVTTGVDADTLRIPPEYHDRVVGTVGSLDAGMIIIDVRGLDTFPFHGLNECGYSLIRNVPEGKELRIDNQSSEHNTNGYIDPQKKKGEQVLMSRSSNFMIYKEDEGHFVNRQEALRSTNGAYYAYGEDNALFVTNNDIRLSGNGAAAHISIV